MKIRILRDELHPCFKISANIQADEIDIDTATVGRWMRVEAAYDDMQDEMKKAVEDAKQK